MRRTPALLLISLGASVGVFIHLIVGARSWAVATSIAAVILSLSLLRPLRRLLGDIVEGYTAAASRTDASHIASPFLVLPLALFGPPILATFASGLLAPHVPIHLTVPICVSAGVAGTAAALALTRSRLRGAIAALRNPATIEGEAA